MTQTTDLENLTDIEVKRINLLERNPREIRYEEGKNRTNPVSDRSYFDQPEKIPGLFDYLVEERERRFEGKDMYPFNPILDCVVSLSPNFVVFVGDEYITKDQLPEFISYQQTLLSNMAMDGKVSPSTYSDEAVKLARLVKHYKQNGLDIETIQDNKKLEEEIEKLPDTSQTNNHQHPVKRFFKAVYDKWLHGF